MGQTGDGQRFVLSRFHVTLCASYGKWTYLDAIVINEACAPQAAAR